KEFVRSLDVARGSAAPNLLGKFHDKTSIEVDRTGGACDGNVYFAWARFTGGSSSGSNSSVYFVRSTDHGRTFSSPMKLSQTVHDIQFRATADQQDATNDYVYLVYDPSIPGTEVPSGTTYGSVTSEDLPAKFHQDVGSQSGIYFFRLNGATGSHTTPTLIDDPRGQGGLQRFPDISVDAGSMHAIWWDSRNDPCYSPARPIGNRADLSTVPSVAAFGASGSTSGA